MPPVRTSATRSLSRSGWAGERAPFLCCRSSLPPAGAFLGQSATPRVAFNPTSTRARGHHTLRSASRLPPARPGPPSWGRLPGHLTSCSPQRCGPRSSSTALAGGDLASRSAPTRARRSWLPTTRRNRTMTTTPPSQREPPLGAAPEATLAPRLGSHDQECAGEEAACRRPHRQGVQRAREVAMGSAMEDGLQSAWSMAPTEGTPCPGPQTEVSAAQPDRDGDALPTAAPAI